MSPLSFPLAAVMYYLVGTYPSEARATKYRNASAERESARKKNATYTRFRIKRGGAIQDFENTTENVDIIASWKADTEFCTLVSEEAKQYYG